MTDNTQGLVEILKVLHINGNLRKLMDDESQVADVEQAKQAILDWHNKQLIKTLERLYPDNNGDISVSDDGGIASNGTIDDLTTKLKESKQCNKEKATKSQLEKLS